MITEYLYSVNWEKGEKLFHQIAGEVRSRTSRMQHLKGVTPLKENIRQIPGDELNK